MSHKDSQRWLDHPRSVQHQDPHASARIPNRAPWMASGACRDSGVPDSWFANPHPNDSTTQTALRVCQRCQVTKECLAYALAADPPVVGIWGGTTAQRRRMMGAAS